MPKRIVIRNVNWASAMMEDVKSVQQLRTASVHFIRPGQLVPPATAYSDLKPRHIATAFL